MPTPWNHINKIINIPIKTKIWLKLIHVFFPHGKKSSRASHYWCLHQKCSHTLDSETRTETPRCNFIPGDICWVEFSFLKKFSLVSHPYCFTCSLQVLLEVWRIWASEAQFLVHGGPQNKSKFWSLVIFSKNFHWFCISLRLHVNLNYF